MSKINKLLTASSGDKFRLVLSSILLVCVPVGITVGTFSNVRGLLLRASSIGQRVARGRPPTSRIIWAVEVVDRYLPGERSCLVQSLVSEALLRLHGYTPTHRIGVDPASDDGFAAHSWLEHGDEVLIRDVDDLSKYDPLSPLDPGDDS